MRKVARTLVATAAVFTSVAWTIGAAGASVKAVTHPTYALGSAKKCKTDFVKKTEKHLVGHKEVRYVACVYVAPAPAKTTAPAPTSPSGSGGSSGTAPAADPPTSVTVTASENHAVVGDTVIYTITVASTAIPKTSGQIEVTDNGVPIQGCYPIPDAIYPGNGALVGSCTTSYNTPETTIISAVFTGDQTYAQSAGSMTETVDETLPVSSGGGGGGGSSPPPATIALDVLLGSPNYTQTGVSPLTATYSATASTTSNGSPTATADGTLLFYSDSSLICTDAVSSIQPSGTCPVTYTSFGSHSMNVVYNDTDGHTASTGGTSETITPPAITVQNVWGTTSPTASPTVSANVQNSSATITVSDSNFEGATTLGLTDNLGDTCSASVGTTTATCTMTVSGVPTYFTLAYPGGTATQTTQAVAPNGTQDVTEDWASEGVLVTTPTINIIGATSIWQYAQISGVLDWDPSNGFGSGTVPPLPIVASAGDTLRLDIGTTGNVSGDPYPLGVLQFTVTGGGATLSGFSADGDTTCQSIDNYSSQAEGSCAVTFSGSGTYTINAEYVSSDSNYTDAALPTLTVDVS